MQCQGNVIPGGSTGCHALDAFGAISYGKGSMSKTFWQCGSLHDIFYTIIQEHAV
jgi:hypothetical protein